MLRELLQMFAKTDLCRVEGSADRHFRSPFTYKAAFNARTCTVKVLQQPHLRYLRVILADGYIEKCYKRFNSCPSWIWMNIMVPVEGQYDGFRLKSCDWLDFLPLMHRCPDLLAEVDK